MWLPLNFFLLAFRSSNI
uniref:Uncharacterized protein n=1 Tax=Anguilla anguilla TaxID=7936 RepID=A0A0E9TVL7_ANGAN